MNTNETQIKTRGGRQFVIHPLQRFLSVFHLPTNSLNVQKTVLLDQTALQSAKADKDKFGKSVISITFTKSGAQRFAQVTRLNIKKRLAIIVNGKLCEAPMIIDPISGGAAEITGRFSAQEAPDVAKQINDAVTK